MATDALPGAGLGSGAEAQQLTTLLSLLRDPVVLVDADDRLVHLNSAAARRLDLDDKVLTGRQPLSLLDTESVARVEFEVAGVPLAAMVLAGESPGAVVQGGRLSAFARIAELAVGGSTLQTTLDALACEVLEVTAAVSCTVVVLEDGTGEIAAVGAAGDPDDHLAQAQEAIRRGAPLRTLAAARRKDPRIERDLQALVRRDVRFAPLAGAVEDGHWRSLLAVPLIARNVAVGAVTTYYPDPAALDEVEAAFLSAMADQVAIAVDTARLFADTGARAAADERNRLARDLHDSIGQNLYSLILQTRVLQSTVDRRLGADHDVLADQVSAVRTAAEATLFEMRSAIGHLRAAPTVDGSGLAAVIREHAAAVAVQHQVEVAVRAPDRPLLLSLAAEDELFRLVTEAVTNSVRHSGAGRIEVEIVEPDDRNVLELTVSDDGCGFDLSRSPGSGHVGVSGMRERAERVGGEFAITSSPTGTMVSAVVPYRRWPALRGAR